MFDIGFGELCVVAVVALLVLGPERLPKAAQTFAKFIIKLRREAGKLSQSLQQAPPKPPAELIGTKTSIEQLRGELATKMRELEDIRHKIEQQLNDTEHKQ